MIRYTCTIHFLSIIHYPVSIYDWLSIKNGQTHVGSKNSQKMKVLRMGWPIVENVPTPCGIILNLSRGP